MSIRFSYILFSVVMLLSFTGCIKDSDNIKFEPLQNPGIGFPFGSNAKNDYILRPAASAQQVSGLLFVNLEANSPATSDIHITVDDNSAALVNAYNAANGTAILPLPRSLWNIPAQLIIKAGERNAQGDITVLNTQGLNFNNQYAIGLRIASADGGNKIAGNLSNLFIVFRVQNVMDGRYNVRGQYYHPSIPSGFLPHNVDSVELWTTGPNSVTVVWPPATPFGQNPSLGFILNNATNAINCVNSFPAAVFYYDLNNINGNTYNNRRDPATGTIYAAYGYNLGPGAVFVPGTSRVWLDTLYYIGPR